MIIADEEALICDFAETYGVYDYRKLPLKQAAIFASGLRDNSRIKMKMAGLTENPDRILTAAVVDRLGALVWMRTKDGVKGRNKPVSILDILLRKKQKAADTDVISFSSGQEFEDERNRLLGKEVKG